MAAKSTQVTGVVIAVSVERRTFKLTLKPSGNNVWYRISPRRTNTPLPTVGDDISFTAYGPEQDIIYDFTRNGQAKATLDMTETQKATPETPDTPPMAYTGLRTSRATVKEPTVQDPPVENGTKLPGHWTKIQLTGQQVELEGYFVLIGEYAVLNRKNGNLYPLTSVRLLSGAQP